MRSIYLIMKIINKKNNKIIADNLKIADNFFSRAKGLLGRTGLNKGEALKIIPCNCIHSFFMKFRFDAVFINKNNEVVSLIEDMQPGKVSSLYSSAYSVIELPSGVIKDSEIAVGDVLEFIY